MSVESKAVAVDAAKKAGKPGYQSTEFWVTIATMVGGLLSAVSGGLPDDWAAGLSGGVAAAYVIARAAVKIGAAFAAGFGLKDS